MGEAQEVKSYKSPQRKLLRFFEKSRNQWKDKCKRTKSKVKRLQNRVRFLEKSKEGWKNRVKELEDEVARIKTEEQVREGEVLKKSHRKSLFLQEVLKSLLIVLPAISTLLAISFFLCS